MHAAVSDTSPEYIRNLLIPTRGIRARSHLRSTGAGDFCIQSELRRRAFSVEGLTEWNALSVSVMCIKEKASFKNGSQGTPVQAGLQLLVEIIASQDD